MVHLFASSSQKARSFQSVVLVHLNQSGQEGVQIRIHTSLLSCHCYAQLYSVLVALYVCANGFLISVLQMSFFRRNCVLLHWLILKLLCSACHCLSCFVQLASCVCQLAAPSTPKIRDQYVQAPQCPNAGHIVLIGRLAGASTCSAKKCSFFPNAHPLERQRLQSCDSARQS